MHLITIQQSNINQVITQTVNARDLHEFLGSKRKFADWVKERIDLYDFIEDRDYVVHKIVTQYNQVDRIDYYISIDMAKEISMVERNEKGKQARQYFIECEKQAKQLRPTLPQTYAEALRQLAQEVEEKEQLLLENQSKQNIIETQQPKVEVYDELISSDGLITVDAAAKMLNKKPQQFRLYLAAAEILRKDKSSKGLPTAEMMNSGYMVCKWRDWKTETSAGTSASVFFTNRGVEYVRKRVLRFQDNHPEMYNKIFH